MRTPTPAIRERLRGILAPARLIVLISAGIAVGLITLAARGWLDRQATAVGVGLILMAVPCSLLPMEAALATLGATSALDGLRIDVGISLTLPRIGLVLLAVRWLALQLRTARLHLYRTPLSVPVAVWFASLVASWVVGPHKAYGLRALAIYFSGALLVLVVGQLARSPRTVAWLVRTLLAMGLVSVVCGLVQWVGHMLGVNTYLMERAANASGIFSMQFRVTPPQDPYFRHLSRPHFLFRDWNVYAGYLQAFWPLLFSLGVFAWTRRSRQTLPAWAFLIASAVTAVIFLITFSRSGWFGGIAALICLLVLLKDRLWTKRGCQYLTLCAMMIVSVVASGLVPAPAVAGRAMSIGPLALRTLGSATGISVLTEIASNWTQWMAGWLGARYTGEGAMSADYHFALLRLCVSAFGSSPILGIGTGGFPFYFNEHAPEWMHRAHTWADPSDKASGMMAHSALGNSFAEGGIVRGVAYLWVFYALFVALHRAIRSLPSDNDRRAVLVGLLGCVVGLFVGNILYDFTSQPFLWFTLAVASAASQVLADGGTERDREPA